MSSRCNYPGGAAAIHEWLDKHDIQGVEDIIPEKPPARCYIDDRAIRFDGDASKLPELVDKFVPWNKREMTMCDKIRNSTDSELIDFFLEKGEPVSWRLDAEGMTYTFFVPRKQKEIIMDFLGQMIDGGACQVKLNGEGERKEGTDGTYKMLM